MMPVISGELDAKIAPLVMALRRDGFPTTASCEGHMTIGGAEPGCPWVNVSSMFADWTIDLTRAHLIDWLRAHNVIGNVCQVYGTIEDKAYPFIRLEVFSPLNEARF